MKIINAITLEHIQDAKPATIYYSAVTCWWTHDPAHLCQTPPPSEQDIMRRANAMKANSGRVDAPIQEFIERARVASSHSLPCDPRGGVLFQTDDAQGFLRNAKEQSDFYGRHGIRAFVAAHHLNCIVSDTDPRSTCAATWEEYNAALDASPVLTLHADTARLLNEHRVSGWIPSHLVPANMRAFRELRRLNMIVYHGYGTGAYTIQQSTELWEAVDAALAEGSAS